MIGTRKRIITIGIASLLALAIFAAPAYAYFTSVVSASGSHDIELGYSSEVTEKHEDPNKSIADKVISIKNTGDTDIMARVFVSNAMDGVSLSVLQENNDWYSESVEGGTMWYYKRVIHPKESSGALRVEVGGPSDEDHPNFDLVVTGQTSPVYYDENKAAHAYAWDKSAI